MKKSDFSPDEFFERAYESRALPFFSYGNNFSEDSAFSSPEAAENIERAKKEIAGKLASALGIREIPEKKEEINPVLISEKKRKGYTVKKMSAEICAGLNMLFYALVPEKPTKSGVVAVCGHGYGVRQIIRQAKNGSYRRINFFDNYQKNFAEALALDGHIVIAFEPVGFGEARLKSDLKKPFYISSCDTLSHHALLYGFTVAALRVYQAMKCADILFRDFGCENTGIMGISGGGLVALYASVLDSRFEKTCVCGYIGTFRTSVLSMWHCPDNYIPGMLKAGEMYDFAASLAPKKLMMQFGVNDRLFPIEGTRDAAKKIQSVYKALGAGDRFRPVEFDGKHEVYLPAALEFFSEDE